MRNQNTNTLFTIAVVITTLTAILQIGSANLAFSQAVELLPINTGNETLDRSLPVFYECIEEAVDASVNAPEQASYFEDEPTRNEVRECYRAVFIDNPSEEASNDDMIEEDEEEDEENGE